MKNISVKFEQILRFFGISKGEVRMEASFVKDFGFDDLQFRCLAFHLENFFKISIRKDEYVELDTIGHAMNFVSKKISDL